MTEYSILEYCSMLVIINNVLNSTQFMVPNENNRSAERLTSVCPWAGRHAG